MTRQQVVVAYDFSLQAELAAQHALDLAARDPELVLHILTVVEPGKDFLTADRIREDVVTRIREMLVADQPDATIEFLVHTRIGAPVDEILGLAQDVGASLIICGSHARNAMGRLLIGSVSEAVLHGAKCPVLIVRAQGYPRVELDKVVEVPPHGIRRAPPHRYSYQSSIVQLRPTNWPIS
jgi:nucleotide-binding universal stress UspA family protein